MLGENSQTRIVGAIFPVLREHASRLFGGQDVFVKFTKLNLEDGSTLVFYISGEKLLVGEAKATRIEKLSPDIAWSRYSARVFLNREAYNHYSRISPVSEEKRRMSKITAFELEDLRRYEKPVKSIYPITPSGRYLTEEMIDNIRRLTS